MSKGSRANEYARKMLVQWARYDATQQYCNEPPFSVEHKLSVAWRDGFEAGQRHQIKIQKAKESSMKVSAL